MHELADRVLRYIRRHDLIRAGDRVAVAVSGGADSVALLRLLLELRSELGVVLAVVHFNHKLREPDAGLDEQFVAALTRAHQLEFHCESGDVKKHAAAHQLGIEAAARQLRYEYFERLLAQAGLNRIATAHTLDDQAETVLLKIVRGAGTRGLAGIYPQISLAGQCSIVRPLLASPRKDVLKYLSDIGQDWREDGSNRDLRFARNRVRHGVLPRLERSLNPSVRESLAEAAEIARGDEEYWTAKLAQVLPSLWTVSETEGVLKLPNFSAHALAVQRRVLRMACETLGLRLDFKHVEELLSLADPDGPKSAGLPDGWTAIREKNRIRISPAPKSSELSSDYEYVLSIPGEATVAETGTRFQAMLVPLAGEQGYNPEHLLDRESVGTQLKIRNWRAGDRFWPAHSKGLKKIKELLQERHITGTERKLWPVAVRGNDVVWVRSFPAPANLRPHDGVKEAVLIREV